MFKLRNIHASLQAVGKFCSRKKGTRSAVPCRWQAAFGYSISVTWFLNMLSVCYVMISGNEKTAEIISAFVETAALWGVALGVLGISFVKGTPQKSANKANKKVKQTIDK